MPLASWLTRTASNHRAASGIARAWFICKASGWAALVMLVAELLQIFAGSNFHCVVPGRCYRSAQPSAHFLETVQHLHGVASILNLRSQNEAEEWYQEEKQAANKLGITLINAGLSGIEQPSEKDLRQFVQVIRVCPEPVLIHCANGNDRTGLASAIYLMTRTDASLPQAYQQLGLQYGHCRWGKMSCLDRILNSYEAWLLARRLPHKPENFVYWVGHDYRKER